MYEEPDVEGEIQREQAKKDTGKRPSDVNIDDLKKKFIKKDIKKVKL